MSDSSLAAQAADGYGAPMLKRWLDRFRGEAPATPEPRSRRSFLLERLPRRSVGAEIGVHCGDFSAQILAVVDPAEIHLVDPWKHEAITRYASALYGGRTPGGRTEVDQRHVEVKRRFEKDARVQVHRGTSEEVLLRFPDGHFEIRHDQFVLRR